MKVIRPHRPARHLGAVMVILGLTVLHLAPPPPSLAISPAPAGQDHGQAPADVRDRVARDLEQALAKARPLLDRYGYPAVFAAIMVEGFGLLAPGQTLLIAAALAAAQGRLNIVWVLLLAFTAAVLGNALGYLLGRLGGRPLLHKFKVNEDRLTRLEMYFIRKGKWLLLIARFFDGLRQLNGIVAGLLELPWQVFAPLNILGAALWTGVWGLGVYFLDKEIASLHLTLRQIGPWVAFLCLLASVAFLGYVLWPDRKKAAGGGPGI